MKYLGSKRKFARYILPIILKSRALNQYYVEPFAGGMNCIENVPGNRIANDINSDLITMYKALQKGWTPPETVTEKEYNEIKFNREDYDSELIGFVGIGCAFGGKWFSTYARGKSKNSIKERNYCAESQRHVLNQIKLLKKVQFLSVDYRKLYIPSNSIIYCDPPYNNSNHYKYKSFNSFLFWDWCREMSITGHKVFISEYQAPEDFTCLWEMPTINNIHPLRKQRMRVERLFTLKQKPKLKVFTQQYLGRFSDDKK